MPINEYYLSMSHILTIYLLCLNKKYPSYGISRQVLQLEYRDLLLVKKSFVVENIQRRFQRIPYYTYLV